jgi:quercetin 2,3-dioxygenase
MPETRKIKTTLKGKPTTEGAGVHLFRAFGYYEAPQFDPFLLLDDFRNDDPERYLRGFPEHPHRGIETITYVLAGDVEHRDSLGNQGVIGAGDVQWMTAGNGIIHAEMPRGDDKGRMYGFQLWANLPAKNKMMDPRYQEMAANEIPVIELDQNIVMKVISGEVSGVTGPVRDVVIDPLYLDVAMPTNSEFTLPTKRGHTVFAYLFEGQAVFDENGANTGHETVVLYDDGDEIQIRTTELPARFLLISGKPIGEPVAWHGPIVMNRQDELTIAFDEYRNGTFIKHR